jgi:hypothetical protein
MVEHLVFLKFKPEVSLDQRKKTAAALVALRGVVPGIIDITCGETFTSRGQGHQLGLFVRLENKAALDIYANHPAHKEVAETMIKPFTDNIMAIDYEF